VDTVSAEVVNPLDSYTVEDWLAEDPPPDGSKRELILGKIRVSPSAAIEHNYLGGKLFGAISVLRLRPTPYSARPAEPPSFPISRSSTANRSVWQ
jgi:hypothetical protein